VEKRSRLGFVTRPHSNKAVTERLNMSELVDQLSLKSSLEDKTVPEDILAYVTGRAGSNNNAAPSLALGSSIGGGVGLIMGGGRGASSAWKGVASDASTGGKLGAAALSGAKGGAKFGVIGAAVGAAGIVEDGLIHGQKQVKIY
jgi:hypothetical protein